MKILHVVHGLARGGLENGVVNLLNGLPADEFTQAVCCLDVRGEMAERVRREVPIHFLARQRNDLKLPWRLKQVIDDWQPDVVHCRNWNTWLDAYAGHRLAGGGRRKLVWSFHGFADRDEFPWRRRAASRLLAGRTDRLAAVCQDAAKRFADKAGISASRFSVLYNGVDTRRFCPAADRAQERAALGIDSDALLVVTVANFSPVKDHKGLLDAVALISPSAKKVRFLFLGEGPLRAVLEAQVHALGLDDMVAMPGSSDQVSRYLAVADLCILPSRLEGMSNAILEAMACGLPVIARAVGGNPELVVDGHTGLLCPPDDAPALAGAIARLIDNPGLRCEMAVAARQRAESVFSIEAMMAAYGDFYRGVVERGRG